MDAIWPHSRQVINFDGIVIKAIRYRRFHWFEHRNNYFFTWIALKACPRKQFLSGIMLLIALRHTEVYMLQMPIE